jgi:hypothetical protein
LLRGNRVFIDPMKSKLVDAPTTGGDWVYELKFDGFSHSGGEEGRESETDFAQRK